KRSREATFEGHRRGGWFNYRLSDVEPTTPAAPKQSVASHFIVRRGDPSLAKEGNTPLVTFSNNDRCPAAELWDTIRPYGLGYTLAGPPGQFIQFWSQKPMECGDGRFGRRVR